ncbi:nitrogen regulatory protein P-II family [Alteromonadaceae bacterium 2753L.S.0a.02]|nr:nitrogen regulatory protein P-II family [Alteromonadaceae bacterium 2753L.S.0a.02]
MKLSKVVAIFDELKLEDIEAALLDNGVAGFTIHPVSGRGRYFDSFNENHLIKHIQIEIYTLREYAEPIGNVIVEAAYSNAESEGLVSIQPVDELYWIHDKRMAQPADFRFKGD